MRYPAHLKQFLTAAFLFGVMLLSPAHAEEKASDYAPKVVMAVFTSDVARQDLLLRNIKNLRKAEPLTQVEVVAFGPGLSLLTRVEPRRGHDNELGGAIASLADQGVKFLACANTMKAQKLTTADLLPAATVVPSGIAHVISRQTDGWAYFAP